MRALVFAAAVLGCVTTSDSRPPRLAVTDDLHVLGDVDSASLAPLAREINAAEPGEFRIYFNSPGGSVFDGVDFLRVMEAAQRRGVRFICTADMAASMGAVIFSACDVRLALPRAMILIHSASISRGGNSRDMRETAETLEAITDALYRQMCRVMNITVEELKKRADGKDYWLDAGRAEELGLVQAILP